MALSCRHTILGKFGRGIKASVPSGLSGQPLLRHLQYLGKVAAFMLPTGCSTVCSSVASTLAVGVMTS